MPSINNKTNIESNFADTEAYDLRIRKFVPYYDEMIESVLRCITENHKKYHILELGCGTGNLTSKLINSNYCQKLTAIDIVEEMVNKCKKRFEKDQQNIEIISADMMNFCSLNTFDYVFANLVLHYPDTNEKKITVCRNIYQSLKCGGMVSFSVMLNGESDENTELLWKWWERDIFKNGVSVKELDEWYKVNHASDYPVSLNSWLTWLNSIGFKHCEVAWKRTIFGTIWAKKLS